MTALGNPIYTVRLTTGSSHTVCAESFEQAIETVLGYLNQTLCPRKDWTVDHIKAVENTGRALVAA